MTAYRLYLRRLAITSLTLLAQPAMAQRTYDVDILHDTFGYDAQTKKSVSLADLHQGCRVRDCIPSIDEPKYVAAADAQHVDDDDIVLALSWRGYHRAWPARILDQHEIVNDFIGGTALAITWCPLCGSAVGVVREIDGRVTEFGVSGLLYNSDLVFYDRTTETLWDQIEAKAIVGPLTGTTLELLPVTTTRWGRWKAAHPDTVVLSEDTGYSLDYSVDAYGKYRDGRNILFPVNNKTDMLHPKAVVYGFDLGDRQVAVTETLLEGKSSVDHEFGGKKYTTNVAADGAITMINVVSGKVFAPIRLYWFAWFTFHPGTELVR